MISLDDLVTSVLLASAAFFVALSVGLLVRYRRLSQTINASSDVGRDLWVALEQRMKKQDERIIDVMGRLEVVQSRMMAVAVSQAPAPMAPPPVEGQPVQAEGKAEGVIAPLPETQQPVSQPESRHESRESQLSRGEIELDETQVAVIKLLADGQKNTRQLTDALRKSREHTARLMKELFELGLVGRNDATKPFVYQLTDEGRRHVQQGV